MAFLFGIPKKLLRRIKEIEIDTHYYDKDVIPSAQEIFTYEVNKKKETATITGLVNNNTITAVIPYQIHYDQTSQELIARVINLSENCFSNNSALKNITIPNTIHVIPTNCFKNCSALETVNIPTSIHTINVNAFNNCDKLSTVFIPHGVNTIEDGAFLDCENLKILCYKHSEAETYAIKHNIPYSLISYTLDDDVTENSENLVTSGIIYKHISWIKNRIEEVYALLNSKIANVRTELINKITNVQTNLTNHINNKNNPHDDATFKNSKLTGSTNIEKGTLTNINIISEEVNGEISTRVTDDSLINKAYLDTELSKIHAPEIGAGYQTVIENTLETDSKTIPAAINEINAKVHTINGILEGDRWNTVSLNKKYPLSWRFLNKPYCYTDEGISVDYRINNKRVIDNNDAFDIYVPIKCNYTLSTTELNEISGYPIDYLIVNYYYTGADGKDLDTVTGVSNSNWPSSIKSTVGYGHDNEITYNGITLIKFGGDNTGGGNANANIKFYESIYFNIEAIQTILPNEDIEVILYGTWYSEKLNGNIHIQFITYESDTIPEININNKVITLSGANETYATDNMTCSIVTKKGSTRDYQTTYTPAFKIIFKKSTNNSNYRTITIQPLS